MVGFIRIVTAKLKTKFTIIDRKLTFKFYSDNIFYKQ